MDSLFACPTCGIPFFILGCLGLHKYPLVLLREGVCGISE